VTEIANDGGKPKKKRKGRREKVAVPMPEQAPADRVKNFEEVPFGYDAEMAIKEAKRCYLCKGERANCIPNCPVGIDIPKFIDEIAEGDFQAAVETMMKDNLLPAVCGRVCPQEEQCQKECLAGKKGDPIYIGRLERFLAEWYVDNGARPEKMTPPPGAKKVAIVGSGPSGLTCAADLARAGYDVTIFEALHRGGGVLAYGIPEFRLPNQIIEREIENIQRLGVKIYLNAIIGKLFTIDTLMDEQGFEAIYVGTGAGLPYMMNVPGKNLKGVLTANEFLTRVNLMRSFDFPNAATPMLIGEDVAVVGGGNVAMDAARTALRIGAERVHLVYRRSEIEMPARDEEIHHAREEGVQFHLLTNPVKLIGDDDDNLVELECVEMELGEPDDSGRRRPVVKEGSEFRMPVQTFVFAIGQGPNPVLANATRNLKTSRWGQIEVDENRMTSIPGVFAGGDVTGGATVITAMGDGRQAAKAIQAHLDPVAVS
jgi:glutamate synthase (NADPH) small chain